ncbi:alpha/beta fold hydrolase [Microbacterium karelineae]|uniref:alpha/beta fold hydrolase n=1 Tax=Microbacterium karelineae TaxID=2654283 RepID=UPI0012EA9B88|nr:alpha/beta hydrolase [Microbacterium karelineae]
MTVATHISSAWNLEVCYSVLERNIKLGPVRTRYFEAGDSERPTVVLIHEGGFGSDAPNTFGRMTEHLEQDYHMLLPEMLGFGGTDKAVFFGESPYAPRLRHLSSFLDALDVRHAHFVGNSFGGGIVLRLSIDPEESWRMASATSISGTGGPYRTQEAVRYTSRYESSIEGARRADEWVLDPGTTDEAHSRDRYESSLRPGQWEAMTAGTLQSPVAHAPAPDGYPESLSQSRVPTLLVAGSLDKMFESGWETRIAAHLRHVRVERVPMGHAPNIVHPVETAAILRRFFDEIEQRG